MANPLRDLLVKSGHITEEDFARAEKEAQKEGVSIVAAVEMLELIDEKLLLEILSKYFRVPVAHLGQMEIPGAIINLVTREIATKHRVVPIDRAGNNIIIAMADPRNLAAIDAIRFTIGFFPKPVLASELRISEAIRKYYGSNLDLAAYKMKSETTTKERVREQPDTRRDITSVDSQDGPIIKLVNQMMVECMSRRASDIHIEPYENFMRIRLRVDGVLHQIARPPYQMRAPLISRIKIMAKMDIAESRLPQDGAINITVAGRPVDFRVSTIPTVYGEKIVMRVLDKNNLQVDMTQLGLEEDELQKFKSSILRPYGMVLVTGPTGSGKTTTLYSALAELNKEADNIMTAEDPVEYNLEGINQVQTKAEIGFDFANALRSFLRQDPDIIMVGEIRDLETAEISIKAALTGHLVLSTLHTNSAPDTISRLINMGVENFNLVAALNCITAQRLLRRICDKCRVVDETVTSEVLIDLGIHPKYADKVRAYRGAGCVACGKTGMRGRIAVHEVLKMSDPVREAILRSDSGMEIKKVAMANGMRTLRQSALHKMVQGLTSALEVTKSTAPDKDDDLVKSTSAA